MTPLRLRPPEELDPIRSRYVKLLIHAATSGEPERPSPMDAGLVLCDVLAGREPRVVGLPENLDELRDSGGHRRPFYGALLVYALALACRLRGSAGVSERDWLESAVISLAGESHLDFVPVGGFAMVEGDRWCQMFWGRLARWMAAPFASAFIEQDPYDLIQEQQTNGSLLRWDLGTNPEPGWYYELVLLHALTSYGAISRDGLAPPAIRRAALFHHRETQPDHATSQPWAIHAFLMDPETIPTADLLLLAAGVNQPGGLGAVPRLLLADAAVALSIA